MEMHTGNPHMWTRVDLLGNTGLSASARGCFVVVIGDGWSGRVPIARSLLALLALVAPFVGNPRKDQRGYPASSEAALRAPRRSAHPPHL